MDLLLIDNYDSFTFNLYQMLSQAGARVTVALNDRVTAAQVEACRAVVISPGPGAPEQAGRCLAVIRDFAASRPILGVCLGHQALVRAFGGEIARASRPLHGKTSRVYHDGKALFAGLPAPLTVGRYHSLIALERGLPRELEVTAYTRDGEIMGVRHRERPLEGVQFHPESILTEHGAAMLRNFLALARAAQEKSC